MIVKRFLPQSGKDSQLLITIALSLESGGEWMPLKGSVECQKGNFAAGRHAQ
jgi:hypothetical protein